MGWDARRESAPVTEEGAARVFLDRLGWRVDYAQVGARETAHGAAAFACEFVAETHLGEMVAGMMLLEVEGEEWASKVVGEDAGPAEPPSPDLVAYCESIGLNAGSVWAQEWRDRATDWAQLRYRTTYLVAS